MQILFSMFFLTYCISVFYFVMFMEFISLFFYSTFFKLFLNLPLFSFKINNAVSLTIGCLTSLIRALYITDAG